MSCRKIHERSLFLMAAVALASSTVQIHEATAAPPVAAQAHSAFAAAFASAGRAAFAKGSFDDAVFAFTSSSYAGRAASEATIGNKIPKSLACKLFASSTIASAKVIANASALAKAAKVSRTDVLALTPNTVAAAASVNASAFRDAVALNLAASTISVAAKKATSAAKKATAFLKKANTAANAAGC